MITVRRIQDVVCEHCEITRDELLQQNRSRKFARPRQIAMNLARELTGLGWKQLAAQFYRDHTTIIAGVESADRFMCRPSWHPVVRGIREALVDPEAESRRKYEIFIRDKWRASIPFHLTPEGAFHERDY